MSPETSAITAYPPTEFAMEQQIPPDALPNTSMAVEQASLWDRAKRDRVFQAFVEAKDRGIAYRQGTAWMDPAERE